MEETSTEMVNGKSENTQMVNVATGPLVVDQGIPDSVPSADNDISTIMNQDGTLDFSHHVMFR